MKKILLFGLSLIILVACGGKKQEQTPSTITESIINETIINDTIVNDVIVSDAIINNDTTIHKYYYKDATDAEKALSYGISYIRESQWLGNFEILDFTKLPDEWYD